MPASALSQAWSPPRHCTPCTTSARAWGCEKWRSSLGSTWCTASRACVSNVLVLWPVPDPLRSFYNNLQSGGITCPGLQSQDSSTSWQSCLPQSGSRTAGSAERGQVNGWPSFRRGRPGVMTRRYVRSARDSLSLAAASASYGEPSRGARTGYRPEKTSSGGH